MICRLCLLCCDSSDAVVKLFAPERDVDEASNVDAPGMIRTFLNIELNPDDPISTLICLACNEHLHKFNAFRKYVAKQQQSLCKEFLEMKGSENEPAAPIEEVLFDVNQTPIELRDIKEVETVALIEGDIKQRENDIVNKAVQKRPRKQYATRKSHPNEQFINANMKLRCDVCGVSLGSYAELRRHFHEAHKRMPYVKCCDSIYQKPNKLVEHLMWHLKPEIFQCDICGKQLKNKQCLELHKANAHVGGSQKTVISAKCHLCHKVYTSLKRLENHVKKHSTARTYPCARCTKTFVSSERLRRHNQAIHENVFPHVCETCGKKFKFKPSFQRHVLEHQGIFDPPVQCSECGQWLKNKHALRLHRFKHDTRDVQCRECGRVCPSRIALRGHMDYMHKLKNNLKCPYCSKTFKMAKGLQEHVATHTGVQLYACPHCSKQCRSKSNMYVHIKRHHTEEWLLAKMAKSNDPSLKEPDISADDDLNSTVIRDEDDYSENDYDEEDDDYYDDDEEGPSGSDEKYAESVNHNAHLMENNYSS